MYVPARSMVNSWAGKTASGPWWGKAGARSQCCFRVHNKAGSQRACYQGHQQEWVLPGPLVDGAVDRTVDKQGWIKVTGG